MSTRSLRISPLVVALGFASLLSAPLRAQDSTVVLPPESSAPATPATTASLGEGAERAGPALETSVVGVRRNAEASRPAARADARSFSRGGKHMIIGGAAVLTGIVVGTEAGAIISVAGGVLFLYGLYQYLQ